MADDHVEDVLLAQQGNRAAFERLVGRFQRQVFFTVFRVLRDSHLADDVTQEVFVKAYRAMAGLQDPGYFKTWLLRIALNRAIDLKRQKGRENEHGFLFDDEPKGMGAESLELDRAQTTDLDHAVRKALDTLPPKMQKVLVLSLDGELPHEAAAQILDCPVGTVKSRLWHARRLLRDKLKKYL